MKVGIGEIVSAVCVSIDEVLSLTDTESLKQVYNLPEICRLKKRLFILFFADAFQVFRGDGVKFRFKGFNKVFLALEANFMANLRYGEMPGFQQLSSPF